MNQMKNKQIFSYTAQEQQQMQKPMIYCLKLLNESEPIIFQRDEEEQELFEIVSSKNVNNDDKKKKNRKKIICS
jgi:hypothetical protein